MRREREREREGEREGEREREREREGEGEGGREGECVSVNSPDAQWSQESHVVFAVIAVADMFVFRVQAHHVVVCIRCFLGMRKNKMKVTAQM